MLSRKKSSEAVMRKTRQMLEKEGGMRLA